jgi:3-carboxy-cis,cis-muconate cycloisomerase
MSDLLRPGADRADSLIDDAALLAAMVHVEGEWLAVLVAAGVAPGAAASNLSGLVSGGDLATLSARTEAGGNPVIPLVDMLRARLADQNPTASRWLHRGLTSQDVLDTALMLCSRAVLDHVLVAVRRQVAALADLAARHRDAVLPGRTLTQYAAPITFGYKAATWLSAVLDAAGELVSVRQNLPAQVGGAAGTAAATTELAAIAGLTDPAGVAVTLAGALAEQVGLSTHVHWHTTRRPLTRLGDALVAATDAWGRIANDVLVLSRPEIGELSEGTAGRSSTMPHKHNPVLSVLVCSAALTAPMLGAQLHLAASQALDERPDGAWHAEWVPLRTLAQACAVAAGQTADLLGGLVVHADRMAEHASAGRADLLAERAAMRELAGAAPLDGDVAHYLGATQLFVVAVLERAEQFAKELS